MVLAFKFGVRPLHSSSHASSLASLLFSFAGVSLGRSPSNKRSNLSVVARPQTFAFAVWSLGVVDNFFVGGEPPAVILGSSGSCRAISDSSKIRISLVRVPSILTTAWFRLLMTPTTIAVLPISGPLRISTCFRLQGEDDKKSSSYTQKCNDLHHKRNNTCVKERCHIFTPNLFWQQNLLL